MKRRITDFSGKEIKTELDKARKEQGDGSGSIRILFSPVCINEENIGRVASVYSRLGSAEYDTVVIVEEHKDDLKKKLSMPSNEEHQTPLGKVTVNDYLCNEFCDEDDDFFINDLSFHSDLSLFHQLMMLQASLSDFKVLNIQISDRDDAIVKELVSAASELLASRNVLLVFCCDLDETCQDEAELKELKKLAGEDTTSSMLNLLNKHSDCITGNSAFKAGLFIARKWGAKVRFLDEKDAHFSLAAYAEREQVFY